MQNKNKTCLLIMPVNNNQDVSHTIKVSTLINIINQFDKGKIDVKIATYKGNKPFLNFENDEKNRKWVEKNEELLLNVMNIDNVSPSKFDGIFIPSYLHIYEELKINDNSLCIILTRFHEANKVICALGHSTYVLCKCESDGQWPFVGFNLSGYSIENMMRDNLFGVLNFVIEEMVMLQGGNFLNSGNLADDSIVVSDRNLVTGGDDASLDSCLSNLINKINKN
jgi:putative intracellular protease/amidase